MTTLAVGMIGGAVLGLVSAVIAIRWPFATGKHWVWQLPIFVVVFAGMTVWAWDTDNDNDSFPATFGSFILALMFTSTLVRVRQDKRS